MPYYLVQGSYTPKAWSVLLKHPENRVEAVRPVVEHLGGKMECGFLAFGEYDAVAIIQMPDNIKAAALSMALMAGGALKKVKTTLLMSYKEGVKAMEKAKKAAYRPPSDEPVYLERE